ncbi:MAG TPA: hypothetical protein VND65_01865 [Candidatus Binatia bacterium]|nr:hypothetical protein [Candidatus Binatia bacterium]
MSREKVIDVVQSPDVREITTVPTAALAKVEVDAAISTAKQYPRDLDVFANKAMKLVETVAMQKSTRGEQAELFYVIPRGGKQIEGPSVRLAEIIAHTYGNCRVGARTVAEENDFVVCQGVFHDLEQNVAITFEVKRRIRDREGRRYNEDMIGTTANAGCGIAYRNAVLKGVPKGFWLPLYERARKLAGGQTKEQTKELRDVALEYTRKCKIPDAAVFKTLGISKLSEMTNDHVATLKGILTAVKDHEMTIEEAFGLKPKAEPKGPSTIKEKPAAAQQEEVKGPISSQQYDALYDNLTPMGLTMQECVTLMRRLGHKGVPKEFPAAKLQDLVAALEKASQNKKKK